MARVESGEGLAEMVFSKRSANERVITHRHSPVEWTLEEVLAACAHAGFLIEDGEGV